MISEQQAVDLVNADIRKTHGDPDYRVYTVTAYDWGWSLDWMPKDPNKTLYGSSSYMVHKNGYLSTWMEVAWDAVKHPIGDQHAIIQTFINKANEKGTK